MTNREFYVAIVNGTELTEEMKAFAEEAIVKLDAVNSKRRETAEAKRAEKEAEKAPIREAIMAVITDEPKTATTLIAEAGVEIKPQSIPSLLKPLVESGVLEKVDVKVKGKGTQKGYKVV